MSSHFVFTKIKQMLHPRILQKSSIQFLEAADQICEEQKNDQDTGTNSRNGQLVTVPVHTANENPWNDPRNDPEQPRMEFGIHSQKSITSFTFMQMQLLEFVTVSWSLFCSSQIWSAASRNQMLNFCKMEFGIHSEKAIMSFNFMYMQYQ
jgi:hypothetical protein